MLLRKGAYPYGYMCDWEMFKETAFPEKEEFYSKLNMEDITDTFKKRQTWFVKTLK